MKIIVNSISIIKDKCKLKEKGVFRVTNINICVDKESLVNYTEDCNILLLLKLEISKKNNNIDYLSIKELIECENMLECDFWSIDDVIKRLKNQLNKYFDFSICEYKCT